MEDSGCTKYRGKIRRRFGSSHQRPEATHAQCSPSFLPVPLWCFSGQGFDISKRSNVRTARRDRSVFRTLLHVPVDCCDPRLVLLLSLHHSLLYPLPPPPYGVRRTGLGSRSITWLGYFPCSSGSSFRLQLLTSDWVMLVSSSLVVRAPYVLGSAEGLCTE